MALQNGFLLIADITGYTVFLNQSELEHAHEVLQTLLELLIDHTRPPLVISRLAGDAVISYGLQPSFISGQTFVEMLEETYVAFRKAIDVMVFNNTCQCNACANTANLDLKFFIHYGTFVLQRLSAHNELVGTDVNVIHRLLKNNVTEKTGIRAYSLFSDAAVKQLGIEEFSQTMTEHIASYPDVGEIRTWVQDMHPIWMARKDLSRIKNPPEQALGHVEIDLPIPVPFAWDIITQPTYRALMMNSISQEIRNRHTGRVGPGSTYHCFHGNGSATVQTILEWVPPEQVTTQDTTPVPKATCLTTQRFTQTATGTRFSVTISRMQGPFLSRLVGNLVGKALIQRSIRNGAEKLQHRVIEDLANGIIRLPDQVIPGEDQLQAEINASLLQNVDIHD